jgi:hypothetical protein
MANVLWSRKKRDCKPVVHLTVREFAQRWHVTDRTVRRWVDQGLPTQDVGDDRWSVTMIPRQRGDGWVQTNVRNGAPSRKPSRN